MGSRGSRGEVITGCNRRTGSRGKARGIPFERKFGLCSGDDKCGLALEREFWKDGVVRRKKGRKKCLKTADGP